MDIGLVLARFVHLASTMSLFGACWFVAALAPASMAPELSQALRRWASPLALLSLASALAWFVFVARAMAGDGLDWPTLAGVLRETAFGAVWRLRLGILLLALLAVVRPDERWRRPAVLSGMSVASLALVGHAAMQDGALGLAHRLNHAVHLLTTAGWLGGLPPFLVCLQNFAQSPSRRDALGAMMNFSRVGHIAVAVVFLTGTHDAAMTTSPPPWPAMGPYRLGIVGKFAIFTAMIGLALVNRYALAPRAGRNRLAARALAAGAVAELGLALAAVALVRAFATLNPA